MATAASSTNTNIEKIGSIKVLSSTSPTASEKSGLIFGGYGYSSDVQANNGDGYSISIKVISKDGKYKISSTDLNVKKDGAKNIIVGNFTFYDFYLVSYSIDKEVENSILTLTYKDKSIFMDKVFIGLFTHHYGNAFDTNGKFVQKPGILNSEETVATFKYKCDDSSTGIKNAFLRRYLNRVQTINASKTLLNKNLIKFPASLPSFLSSDAFFSRYYYNTNGVNGGFIILGREEINEENCSLPEVSYCFKDLTSALAYSDIPGIVDFNLGDDNEIYRILRRKYFGSLRSVLDQWGGDFGFKFYYQPKIDFYSKNYGTPNIAPVKVTINEGIKLINLTSTSTTLKNLNSVFNDLDIQKVVENLSETATLEGTRKTNVVTPIRREARSFTSSSSTVVNNTAQVLTLDFLPYFYGNNPASDATVIGGTLSLYDPALRDIYHLSKGNILAMGMQYVYPILADSNIVSRLDFLLLFGPGLGDSPSAILDDYVVYLGIYDEAKHNLIKEWEKAVMSDYYGKYYMLPNANKDSSYCDGATSYSITYSTVPQSESYIANELPFANLLFGNFGDNTASEQSKRFPENFGGRKYNPIFKAENPFDANNESNYKTFSESILDYESSKAMRVINLKEDPRAKMALFNCFAAGSDNKTLDNLITFIEQNNASLIICKKFKSAGVYEANKTAIADITISNATSVNSSVRLRGQSGESTGDLSTCKTFCEQTLAEAICGDTTSINASKQADTGFTQNFAREVTITSTLIGGLTKTCSLILPATSNYRYCETRDNNNTITLAGASYVIGSPPIYEGVDNVMSYEVIDNVVPEILAQSTTSTGVIDQVVTFDETGKNQRVLSAKDYHDRVSKNLNNSVPDAFEQKKVSLTSTYIPHQLVSYIFSSPILNSINFSFNESGFNTTLDFSSRPKQPKQKDSLFLTERFLRKL
jgi:hypothetical protein